MTFEWTPEKISELTQLWTEGLTTAEIGTRLGCGKNAAISKAHRMKLSGRPSPIKRTGPRIFQRVAKVKREATVGRATQFNPQGADQPKRARRVASDVNSYAALGEGRATCAWPIGHPRDPDYHTCTKKVVAGKPYCAEHCGLAFDHRQHKPGSLAK